MYRLSPNSERDSIMSCAVKSSFNPILHMWLGIVVLHVMVPQ
jgi:hypothetical protein